ncbi:hypothetical protein, partial [Treponema sp. R80B11-R83G3]
MKKAIIGLFLIMPLFLVSVYSQEKKIPSGYDELLFGTSIDDFLKEYSGFIDDIGPDFEKKNIKVFLKIIDPMRGSSIY